MRPGVEGCLESPQHHELPGPRLGGAWCTAGSVNLHYCLLITEKPHRYF